MLTAFDIDLSASSIRGDVSVTLCELVSVGVVSDADFCIWGTLKEVRGDEFCGSRVCSTIINYLLIDLSHFLSFGFSIFNNYS